jgi:ABC-type multidrug transport system fused ATPase/permease subunit
VRYQTLLPLVLDKVSFSVGVVSRTGSGKSTIRSDTLRLLEAEHGRIIIDGVDISAAGLHALRTHSAVIPQHPTLLACENLHLFGLHSDENLRKVLEDCYLVHLIDDLPHG